MTAKQLDDDATLKAMLESAERLCQCGDALLVGQYRHLKDRIRALLELRMADAKDAL